MQCTSHNPLGHIHYSGPYYIPTHAHNVLCPDGIRRSAHNIPATGPDTYFSLPATVKVRGKSVRGFLTTTDNNNHPDIKFIPCLYCKNHTQFPSTT